MMASQAGSLLVLGAAACCALLKPYLLYNNTFTASALPLNRTSVDYHDPPLDMFRC
jgi:hypothetical protein